MIVPRFTHDCDSCVFVGWANDGADDLDLYICQHEPTGNGSVIGRYGNDGAAYCSIPIFQGRVLTAKPAWVKQAIKGTNIKPPKFEPPAWSNEDGWSEGEKGWDEEDAGNLK